MENPDTPVETLLRAAEIGRQAGLKFIYAGNLPGKVGELENTRCHQCGETLIERWGYFIRSYRITEEGRCPACETTVPGRWAREFDGQITSLPFVPRRGRARDRLIVME
jgi:pyruvate formate lyase activating enzyme